MIRSSRAEEGKGGWLQSWQLEIWYRAPNSASPDCQLPPLGESLRHAHRPVLPITNLLDFLFKLLSLIEDNEHILLHLFSLQHTIQAEYNTPRVQCRKVGIFFWQPLHWLFYPPCPVSHQQCFPQMLFQDTGMGSSSGLWGKEQCGAEGTEFHWGTGFNPETPRGIDPLWLIPGGVSHSPLPWWSL